MKFRFATVGSLMILVALMSVFPGTTRAASEQPSMIPPIVREGDLAIPLAERLGLGGFQDELSAEYALAGAGVTPVAGWIADYPVTPEIGTEIRDSSVEAAASGTLPMTQDAVDHSIDNVFLSLGLPPPGPGSTYSQSMPEEFDADAPAYDPAEVEQFYEDEGPPIVSYAPPPEDYAPLYSYVPSPFWFDGFGFPGFFILHDFHKEVKHGRHHGDGRYDKYGKHERRFVSNHVRDRETGAVRRVEPAVRGTERLTTDSPRIVRGGTGATVRRNVASSGPRRDSSRTALVTRGAPTRSGASGRVATPRSFARNPSTTMRGLRNDTPRSVRSPSRTDRERFQARRRPSPSFENRGQVRSGVGRDNFQRFQRSGGDFGSGGGGARFRSGGGFDNRRFTGNSGGGGSMFRRGGFQGRSGGGFSGGNRGFSRGGTGASRGGGGFSRSGGGCRGRC